MRYLEPWIQEDLDERKVVLLGGPRQVGKTTLAKQFLKDDEAGYLNWDSKPGRDAILTETLPASSTFIILEEIHKYKKWKQVVKGFYDTLHKKKQFIVTGSAKLDTFRKGGDSLFGRSRFYRLHPLSLPEIIKYFPEHAVTSIDRLFQYGGFPEPYLKKDARFLARWQFERMEKVIKEDLRDLENVRDLSKVQLLAELLPSKVGSPLSVKSIREDLDIAHATAEKWIQIFESLYISFRIPPLGSPKVRAVKKEQKLFLWDWSVIEDPGHRFENMVASHLLKFCHYQEDVMGCKTELRYLRDTDGREVDFVVIQNKKPVFAVECKLSEKAITKELHYFKERVPVPRWIQVSLDGPTVATENNGIEMMNFQTMCKELKLV